MPDGTSRFEDTVDRSLIYHFMGCSTMSKYTVLAEISCAVIDKGIALQGSDLEFVGGGYYGAEEVEEFAGGAVEGGG